MDKKNKILNKFLEAQNRLVIQSSDLSLEAVASMVEGNAIEIAPKYQRRERWGIEKQSALIESFLLNIPVPPIFLAEDEYGKYSVIDGKQRITSIYNFIKVKQKLKDLENFTELEGENFDSLPSPLQNALKIRPYIRVITLLKQSDPELKYEVFTRLNTGGETLLPQEIRNVAYRGHYNDMIFDLAENDFLRKKLKIKNKNSKAYKEMTDAEYVLRFFTLREQWKMFSGNMRIAMDGHMERHYKEPESQVNESREDFNKCLNLAKKIWGDTAFKRPENGSYRNQILQGIYDVQTVPFSLLSTTELEKIEGKEKKIEDAFVEYYNQDEFFQDSIRQFTSNPDRVYYRISKMLNLIKETIN